MIYKNTKQIFTLKKSFKDEHKRGIKKKMNYQEILENLQYSINHKRQNDLFFKSLKDFKQIGFRISTKFLRGLCTINDNRKKTDRIAYLLRSCNLKTKRQLRFFQKWAGSNFKATIKEYGFKDFEKVNAKNLINSAEIEQYKKFKPYELTEQEQEQINQIREIKNKHNIGLFPKAKNNLNEKNRIKNAIYNKNCGFAVLNNVKTANIGREFIGNYSEVVHFVKI